MQSIGRMADVQLALSTRAGNAIHNNYSNTPCTDGDRIACDGEAAKYPSALRRPVGPTNAFNCHGLTFAARRTQIVQTSAINQILQEDGYRKLDVREIIPGDIALYVKDGEIQHSGIVLNISSGMPWILSKWGQLQEAIHKPTDCPYHACNVVYYRLDS